jgi:hypothetical protein
MRRKGVVGVSFVQISSFEQAEMTPIIKKSKTIFLTIV